jgi:capsular exopolysaccharide synthesis family protein
MADHLRAVRKNWWIVLLATILGIVLGMLATDRAQPQYASSVTFFVSAAPQSGTALQADEFAQRRINSYVGVLTSESFASRLIEEHDLDLTPADVMEKIGATADTDTVLLHASVVDDDADRSLQIATAIAEEFGPMVGELDDTGGGSGVTVSLNVISGPTLDPDPVSPRPALNLGVGLLVGLAAGVALAVAREMADRSIRSVTALERATGAPVLASVAVESGSHGILASTTGVGSTRAEAYRQLRTNLMFSNIGKKLQAIVVSSAVSGEGKSTTAVNLAMVLAETGRPVLLVDADLRRPSVAGYLDIEGGAGLTNVLAGQLTPDDAIQRWGSGGLHVLACGTLPPNPSELIGSDAMATLMAELRMRFDVIIIDTPPLLPVTDAAVAAAHADGVVLVVRHGKTDRERVAMATRGLRAVDAHVAGTVLNAVPRNDSVVGDDYHAYTAEEASRALARRVRRSGGRKRPGSKTTPPTTGDRG